MRRDGERERGRERERRGYEKELNVTFDDDVSCLLALFAALAVWGSTSVRRRRNADDRRKERTEERKEETVYHHSFLSLSCLRPSHCTVYLCTCTVF
jgi:hypothetical protein